MRKWGAFNWVDWDFRTGKLVRPEIKKIIDLHRPPHEVRQRMGLFGVEEVECLTCRKTLWDIDETSQVDVY